MNAARPNDGRGRLSALEDALHRARLEASRASELDVDEQLGFLLEIIVERRRREIKAHHPTNQVTR